MTVDQLQKAGDEFVRVIQDEMAKKNLNDTGKGSNSLSAKATVNKILVSGLARVLFLEHGRAPGKQPPIEDLKGWVERRLNVSPEEIDSVAFAIAKKIAKEGTNIFTDRAKGIQIDIILKEFFDELSKKVISFESEILFNQVADLYNGTK